MTVIRIYSQQTIHYFRRINTASQFPNNAVEPYVGCCMST